MMDLHSLVIIGRSTAWPWHPGAVVKVGFLYYTAKGITRCHPPFHYSYSLDSSPLDGQPVFQNQRGEGLQLVGEVHRAMTGDYHLGWDGGLDVVHVAFRDARDAVMFKLRWT